MFFKILFSYRPCLSYRDLYVNMLQRVSPVMDSFCLVQYPKCVFIQIFAQFVQRPRTTPFHGVNRDSNSLLSTKFGDMAEWLIATDCKSVLNCAVVRIHLSPPNTFMGVNMICSLIARQARQTESRITRQHILLRQHSWPNALPCHGRDQGFKSPTRRQVSALD